MINSPYASLDLLIHNGIGTDANEVCANLIGKIDQMQSDTRDGKTWDDMPQIRITAARVEHDPTSMYPYYVNIDAELV